MTKPIVFFIFCYLFHFGSTCAQVEKSAYTSDYFIEKAWNKSQKHFLVVETVYKMSHFVFDQDGIKFKKGNSNKWLYNNWEFQKTEHTANGSSMDTYLDEKKQKVVVNYGTSEIWYYHGPDLGTGRYSKLTVFKECKVNEEFSQEVDDREEVTESKREKFRIDMNFVSIYDSEEDSWSEWKSGYNTFVINANSNGDIIHIKADGSEANYRRISRDVHRETTSEGKAYQIIDALDDVGDKFQFQIFDDVNIGIKMIYGNVMIQFAKN